MNSYKLHKVEITSDIAIFVDDTKLSSKIKSPNYVKSLQQNLDMMEDWAETMANAF